MALTLENINLTKQRTRFATRTPGAMETLKALFLHLQQLRNPDLQFVVFDCTDNTDIVIADVACKVYAIYYKKPATSTTAAWLKCSDSASAAAAAGDVVVPLPAAAAALKEAAVVFPDGLNMVNGFTLATHQSVNGNTDSADADSPSGFVIVGAA